LDTPSYILNREQLWIYYCGRSESSGYHRYL